MRGHTLRGPLTFCQLLIARTDQDQSASGNSPRPSDLRSSGRTNASPPPATADQTCDFFYFFLFLSHSHQASRLWRTFIAAVRAMAACCKLSFALRPGPSQENDDRTKEKQKRQRKETPSLSLHFSDAMKAGVGRNNGCSTSAPSASAAALLSSSRSLRSRSSRSDTSLCASSSAGGGTRVPTSVVERKSSTALLHHSSASRSRTFQRPIHSVQDPRLVRGRAVYPGDLEFPAGDKSGTESGRGRSREKEEEGCEGGAGTE
jgi:hypothetical protein